MSGEKKQNEGQMAAKVCSISCECLCVWYRMRELSLRYVAASGALSQLDCPLLQHSFPSGKGLLGGAALVGVCQDSTDIFLKMCICYSK